jgi:phage FluMu gp28-like protein
MGWDVAESEYGDFSTFCVLRRSGDDIEIVDTLYVVKGTPLEQQIEAAMDLAKRYHCVHVVVDYNGIGRHPATILQKRLGESIVLFFTPTMQSKAEACTMVKKAFQSGNVRMPADKQVEQDFESIDKIITKSNNVIYSAGRTNGSHGDMFWAFAMAMTAVPLSTGASITGVQHTAPKLLGSTDEQPRELTIRERIERNKKYDEQAKRKFTM